VVARNSPGNAKFLGLSLGAGLRQPLSVFFVPRPSRLHGDQF